MDFGDVDFFLEKNYAKFTIQKVGKSVEMSWFESASSKIPSEVLTKQKKSASPQNNIFKE